MSRPASPGHNTLICPHCRADVPRGATVCRGCQAEIEYGVPKGAYGIALLAAALAGVVIAKILPDVLGIAAWVVAGGAFYAGCRFFQNRYADRTNFKRIYRTR